MESPKGIEIPEHWLKDNGVTKHWPFKEGIWVNDETNPYLSLVCVFYGLMELTEASDQLDDCSKCFIEENDQMLDYYYTVGERVKAGKDTRDLGPTSQFDNNTEKIRAIYKPWVDKWALGSDKMLVWVAGSNIVKIILETVGFNRQALRRLQKNSKILSDQLGCDITPPWIWEIILNDDYRRTDQTKRKSARQELRNDGYRTVREEKLWEHLRYWIIVRILEIKPKDLLDELNDNSIDGILITEQDLSDKILKPFDEVFEYERKRGRPSNNQ